jgi:hypothetical protein
VHLLGQDLLAKRPGKVVMVSKAREPQIRPRGHGRSGAWMGSSAARHAGASIARSAIDSTRRAIMLPCVGR